MGCDIHMYVEKRIDGKWTAMDQFVDEYDEGSLSVPYKQRAYTGRNYNLFAILADVRNGRGFAGIRTGEGFNPIAEPRGVPDDASPEYLKQVEQWGCDGHSHSYHSLRDLLDFDWTQTTTLSGCLNAVAYAKWLRWDKAQGLGPSEYSAGVFGDAVKHVSPDEMEALLDPVLKEYGPAREEFAEKLHNTYTRVAWETPYYREGGEFISETIPKLLAMAGGIAGAEDLRIVFFFDN